MLTEQQASVSYLKKFHMLSYNNRSRTTKNGNTKKQLNFSVKLLAGQNVVLVECDGYESELFMPFVGQGRISLQNIIPERRCCSDGAQRHLGVSRTNSRLSNKVVTFDKDGTMKEFLDWRMPTTSKENILKGAPPQNDRSRFAAGQNSQTAKSPLASSTPQKQKKARVLATTMLDTPEEVRRVKRPIAAEKELPVPELPMKSISTTPTLHHLRQRVLSEKQLDDSARSRIQKTMTPIENSSTENFSINLPQTPVVQKKTIKTSAANPAATPMAPPPTNMPPPQATPKSNVPESAIKWRKVQTPKYTYSRINKLFSGKKKTPSSNKKSKWRPNHLSTGTQGPKPTQKVEIKRRRLILDAKLVISPRSFKAQQLQVKDNRPKVSLKTRKLFQLGKDTAFDLLTNSNRFQRISPDLNRLFRNGCLNKYAATNPKYKPLITVPPLENDAQVHNLKQQQVHSWY